MTIDDLCTALAAGTPEDWYVNDDGLIRRNDGLRTCCPLTALTDVHYTACFHTAARKLGVSEADASAIVAAADNSKDNSAFDPVIRLKLMKATILRHTGSAGRRITDRMKGAA
jgi:hypothetical protein